MIFLHTENSSPQGYYCLIERKLKNLIFPTASKEWSIAPPFYHEIWGNLIVDKSMMLICLTGFGEKYFPAMIEIDAVLSSTNMVYLVPSWDDSIKVDFELY